MPPAVASLSHECPQRVVAYRATSRFFLRLSGSLPPNRRRSPNSAKSPGQFLSKLADDTLGGRVQKMSDWTDEARTISRITRRDGFSGRNLQLPETAPPPIAAAVVTRIARPLPSPSGEHRAKKREDAKEVAFSFVFRWGRAQQAGKPESTFSIQMPP